MPPKRTVKRTKETSKKQQGEEEKADSASSIEPSVKKRRKVADKDDPTHLKTVTKRKPPSNGTIKTDKPAVKKKTQGKEVKSKSHPPKKAANEGKEVKSKSHPPKKAANEGKEVKSKSHPPKKAANEGKEVKSKSHPPKKAANEGEEVKSKSHPPKKAANEGEEVKSKSHPPTNEGEEVKSKSHPPKKVLNETYTLDPVLEAGHHSYGRTPGVVMVMGQGDVGQLGLGERVIEKKRPCKVGGALEGVRLVQVECGGMHSVALSSDGKVFTWGCNDEGALGRDGDECDPAIVPSLSNVTIVQVSAGDSHTVALTDSGDVYCWGVFRDSSGAFGLVVNTSSPTPDLVYSSFSFNKAVKVVSGADHVAILTDEGDVYTLGCAEQGQLGRVPERFTYRGGRRGLSQLLTPAKVHFKNTGRKRTVIKDIFCGAYFMFAIDKDTQQVYGWGLNNYHQLEPSETVARYHPCKLDHTVSHDSKTVTYSGGEHHTVMCTDGVVKVVGRKEYGRVGLGEDAEEPKNLTPLRQLESVTTVASGGSCSFAVTKQGEAYSWGMGTNLQLGSGEEEDRWVPEKVSGKQLEGQKVIGVSVGGQHTALLVAIETDSE